MNHENVQFDFRGFNPDFEMKNFISTVAEKIHLNAPSDAVMKMAMQKGKGAIKAYCRIVSRAGTFVAEAVSDSPVRAVQQVEHKIRAQLETWKAWRFLSPNSQKVI